MTVKILKKALNEYSNEGFSKIKGEGAYLEKGLDILARCDEDNPADRELMQTLDPDCCYLTIDGGEVLGEVTELTDLIGFFKNQMCGKEYAHLLVERLIEVIGLDDFIDGLLNAIDSEELQRLCFDIAGEKDIEFLLNLDVEIF